MQSMATWGEWARKVFAAAFVWLLVSIGLGFVAGSLFGDVSLYFFIQFVVPFCLLGFAIQVAILWRKRPGHG